MTRSRRRLAALLLSIPLFLIGMAEVYRLGMARLEGKERGFWDALEWAAESLSTTGYGRDSHWEHPLMVLFVISVQIVGLMLLYLVFPIYLLPFLEERFEARLPRRPPPLEGHVVVYHY